MTACARMLVVAAAVFAVSCGDGRENRNAVREPAEPRKRVYVLFVDMTLSLNETQKRSIDAAVRQLFSGMPAGSRIVAYPIAAEVQQSGRLLDTELPGEGSAPARIALKKARLEMPGRLYANMNRMLTTAETTANLRKTCIADALRQASVTTEQFGRDHDVEIVLISDMLEDCPKWFLDRELSLEKPAITAEMKIVGGVPQEQLLVDLHGAPVTAIIPPAGLSDARTPRPLVADVRKFWRAVLDRCNDRRDAYSLDNALPDRLRPAPPRR